MAAIGILDELGFAQARFVLGKKLVNLPRIIHEDVGEISKVEADDMSELLGERLQKPEYVGLTEFVIRPAKLFALGPEWWCRHQLQALNNVAVRS
jgi:hypothetical protein